MMSLKVLYLGDTSLETAASYLAGVLSHHGIEFEYVASDVMYLESHLADDCDAVIVSDYMSKQFARTDLENIVQRVRSGMGLLMIGGWESFTGLGGDYHNTPLADLLPVIMQSTDDRINSYAPCMIRPDVDHEITGGLPFAEQSAAINGYNKWQAKDNAKTILSLQRYSVELTGDEFQFASRSLDPLLVVDQVNGGRVACYAGDVAPHWAGGFVDWGDRRCVLKANGAEEIEVGNWYVEFFGNLVKWVGKELN